MRLLQSTSNVPTPLSLLDTISACTAPVALSAATIARAAALGPPRCSPNDGMTCRTRICSTDMLLSPVIKHRTVQRGYQGLKLIHAGVLIGPVCVSNPLSIHFRTVT